MKTIIDTDAFKTFIDEQGINQRTRKDYVKWSRYICFKWLHECGYTLTRIGLFFDKSTSRGYMDHTTILHGIRMYDDLKRYDDFKDIMEELEPILHTFMFIKETIEDYDTMKLTELEREVLNCNSFLDFLKVKNKLINELKSLK